MITVYPVLAAHLWQSTLFGVVFGLLTLLLRKNPARTRYWVWLAALIKFLVPFGVLVSLGGHLSMPGWRPKAPLMVQPAISFVMGDMNESALPVLKEVLPAPQPTNSGLPAILFGVWACGLVAITFRWLQRWIRVRADVRAARPLPFEIGIPVVSSPVLREPGVFGVFRPVLLLPEGMAEELSKPEWEAILAHELCHARCYDNLTAAIYMLVETIFWFHPLVWWLGKRLVVEREFACDEEVLRSGSEPRVYAEGILKVCELYLESPLECVAGVTGSNLRRRLRAIMTNRGTEGMNMGKKLMLAAAGMVAVVGPIVVGVLNTPIRAQSEGAPKFEVSSVKPCQQPPQIPGGRGLPGANSSPGRLSTGCAALLDVNGLGLIRDAYLLFADARLNTNGGLTPINGGPAWLHSAFYEIDATAEGNPSVATMMGPMLQGLLEDRFQLKIHRQQSEGPVYLLTVARGGPKLQSFAEGSCTQSSVFPPPPLQPGQEYCRRLMSAKSPASIEAQGATLDEFSKMLLAFLDRPVIDRTGITGRFDIRVEFSRDGTKIAGIPLIQPNGDRSPASDPSGPASIFTALQEQLGLRLESGKGAVETLVIDHIERPSEN
jgi:bla regulator protein BlaR1